MAAERLDTLSELNKSFPSRKRCIRMQKLKYKQLNDAWIGDIPVPKALGCENGSGYSQPLSLIRSVRCWCHWRSAYYCSTRTSRDRIRRLRGEASDGEAHGAQEYSQHLRLEEQQL
jgi:hypothetical protein